MRLDTALYQRGIANTRSQAERYVKEGNVLVNGKVELKPSKDVSEKDLLTILEKQKYVSRAGDKLDKALESFGLKNSLKNKIALDIGSSTGGFTDCLLRHGVQKVYAVDVGTDQFDKRLTTESRVVLMEKTDIRDVVSLPELVDIIVVDVSFISLSHIVPRLKKFIKNKAEIVLLIKPQFEVGKENINRQGLVKDESLYGGVLDKIKLLCLENNFVLKDIIDSPILGGSGNKEFLLHAIHKI